MLSAFSTCRYRHHVYLHVLQMYQRFDHNSTTPLGLLFHLYTVALSCWALPTYVASWTRQQLVAKNCETLEFRFLMPILLDATLFCLGCNGSGNAIEMALMSFNPSPHRESETPLRLLPAISQRFKLVALSSISRSSVPAGTRHTPYWHDIDWFLRSSIFLPSFPLCSIELQSAKPPVQRAAL
jgi:hypothetical protein